MIEQTDGNPPENRLAAGASADKLSEAVRLSGYPLQQIVAQHLASDFSITEEWGYLDRESGEHRALDVFARRDVSKTNQLWVDVALLVECKRSDLPYVFFEAAVPRIPKEFPVIAGLYGRSLDVAQKGIGSRSAPVAEFLKLADFPFVSNGPAECNSFTRAERKGKKLDLSGSVPFNQVVLPLISSLEHFVRMYKNVGVESALPVCLSLPICVVDGPMVSVKGGPGDPQLSMSPWIRVVRQEATEERHFMSWRYYVVDFVHRAYLTTFVRQNLQHFAQQFMQRVSAGEKLLRDRKALVPNLEEWEFGDLRPVREAD